MRELLSLDVLNRMRPAAAAALLRFRQAEGASDLDADVLARWLANDPANRDAWDSANRAWTDFDSAGEDDVLAALRIDARRAAERPPRLSRAAAIGVFVLLAVAALVGTGLQRSCGAVAFTAIR